METIKQNNLTMKMVKEDDWYVIECIEVPCVTQGRTKTHAIEMLKESVTLWLEVVAEHEPDIYEKCGLDRFLMEGLTFDYAEREETNG